MVMHCLAELHFDLTGKFIKICIYRRMAVENVVIAFTWRTSPNMSQGVTQLLHVI